MDHGKRNISIFQELIFHSSPPATKMSLLHLMLYTAGKIEPVHFRSSENSKDVDT